MKRLVVLLAIGCSSSTPTAKPAVSGSGSVEKTTTQAPAGDAGALVTGRAVPDGGTTTEQEAPKEERNVKITVTAIPRKPKVKIYWGRKLLGETPYVLERPRDSGPVDLVIKGEGYLNLHTRAYTYKNDVIYARMTKIADKMKLLGAKQEILPPEGTPDGGVPPVGPPVVPPAPPP